MTHLPAGTIMSICSFVTTVLLVIPTSSAQQLDFNRDIRPILSDKCFHCHGPDSEHREADLRLDTHAGATADLGDHKAVDAKQPKKSAVWGRVTSKDPDIKMPPPDSGKSLTDEEITKITAWLEQGAQWSEHWAYIPAIKHEVAAVKNADWADSWVDSFVLARLEAEGLTPSKDADNVTLIRRLYFDLIGLPPSPEEVDQFANDASPKAYENLVDRLLKSPHFGERMAIYWLDLVRFADTVGYHGDQDHSISPYRDYVITAFNENLPFDQFTREQLAGDLIPNSTIDQKIATGYNRLLQTSHEGGVQQKEYLAIYAADRIRNLSNVWMGATMGCCQCHDHKYDPYTQRDFYSMVSFFADIDEAQHFSKGGNSLPTNRPPELNVISKLDRQRITDLEAEIAEIGISENGEQKQRVAELAKQVAEIRKRVRKTMVTVSIAPRTIRILPRGNWLDDSGEIVAPAIPKFLGELKTEGRASRLDLANWLTDPAAGSGKLTARVFANRFWYLTFGVGLSRSLDDFGNQGEPPSHPELLDNLADEFVASGWDVKHMLKLMVMSRAYRQSSLQSAELRERDPYNQLVARQSRFRLPAETIRDNALMISGLLVADIGGASVKPYQPAGYYRHLNFPVRKYSHDPDARQWRRGVYMHWQRQFLHPMLKAFDAPSREECTAQRTRSNTPNAALTLLNDPTFNEAARKLAERIVQHGGQTVDSKLDYLFLLALSRKPDEKERELMNEFLNGNRQYFVEAADRVDQLLSVGQSPINAEINRVDLATWTATVRALLNTNEAITRN
ncbi:MAG: hypothetical protein ACI9G1_003904 [Pirellulaceae bacterium]|jgi:hypothetical protein